MEREGDKERRKKCCCQYVDLGDTWKTTLSSTLESLHMYICVRAKNKKIYNA